MYNRTLLIRDRVVQLYHPASPYIKTSFEGILMYEMAGGFINKYVNYADPILMYGVTGEKRPIFSESDAFLYNLVDPTIDE
jgi:hypothetical protein